MRQATAAAYLLVFASVATLVPEIPRPVSFVLFGLVFVGVLAWGALDDARTLAISYCPSVLAGAAVIWTVLTLGFIRSPAFDGLLRLGAFVVVTGGALFVLPSLIPRRDVYRALASVATALVVCGLLVVFLGEIGPFGVWRTESVGGFAYHVPLSVFGNPNTLGLIAALGALAAAGEVCRGTRGAWVLATVCALGAVASTSRTALLALCAGVGVLVVAHTAGRRMATMATLGGLAAVAGAVAIITGVVPGPAVLAEVSLSGRGELWAAAGQAVLERPVLGWGPGADASTIAPFLPESSQRSTSGPHSSYVRMFLAGGLVGGLAYLGLCAGALRQSLMAAHEHATTLSLVVCVLVVTIFSGVTLFGVHPVSFVGALGVGYAQESGARRVAVDVPAGWLVAHSDAS